MRDRIEISKSLIPYSFDILLGADWYTITIKHNRKNDIYTASLERDGAVLVYGEPLMYGHIMFSDLYTRGDFPALQIVPFDESEQETAVTSENFGKTVFLTIDQGEENGQ